MKAMWLWWSKLDLRIERQQLFDEGRDISSVSAEFDELLTGNSDDKEWQKKANALMEKSGNLPMRADYPYVEPSDWEGICAERNHEMRFLRSKRGKHHKVRIPCSKAKQKDIIYGAWLGRVAGCLLGKPLEGTLRTRLVKFLDDLNLKELTDYPWRLSGLTEKIGEGFNKWHGNTLTEFKDTKDFPGDDDTNYTVMEMAGIKKYGMSFTSSDMAEFLLKNVPVLETCTAERVACRNLLNNIEPPDSAIVRNPYREWIGAQIRADFFGYVALGNPRLAAELAWRDARISHVKNGIYGAMWVAAMIAAAASIHDVRELIKIGLNEIPQRSRFHEGITEILKRYDAGATYFEMLDYIHEHWDENFGHDWCHVISNAQIVAIGLLYSDGDYEKAITRAVQICLDTDCNGATVGSIMGMMLGAKALPKKWTELMNDTIHTSIAGYDRVKISDLAREMYEIYERENKKK